MAKQQTKRAQASDERDDGLKEKMVAINRVTKVVKGGRILGFAALTVVGDGDGRDRHGQGQVPRSAGGGSEGDGRGASQDAQGLAQERHPAAYRDGQAWRRVGAHAPAPAGTGIIAGGPMRAVFEVMGVTDVICKCIGSANPYNVVRATINGLMAINTPAEIAAKRGKSVEEILG
jgi:small subunit ribosomal protein S5